MSKEISNLLFNKGFINQFYSNESKQQIKESYENESISLKNEIANLESVIKYAAYSLSTYINLVKEFKLDEYRKIIKVFSSISRNNANLVRKFIII